MNIFTISSLIFAITLNLSLVFTADSKYSPLSDKDDPNHEDGEIKCLDDQGEHFEDLVKVGEIYRVDDDSVYDDKTIFSRIKEMMRMTPSPQIVAKIPPSTISWDDIAGMKLSDTTTEKKEK